MYEEGCNTINPNKKELMKWKAAPRLMSRERILVGCEIHFTFQRNANVLDLCLSHLELLFNE